MIVHQAGESNVVDDDAKTGAKCKLSADTAPVPAKKPGRPTCIDID